MVEIFISFAQAAENFERLRFIRLMHVNPLETASQRRVLFDVFAIFFVRRRADDPQRAARQRGLENIGRVQRAFRAAARADEGVQLVDKEDDVAALLRRRDNALDSFLKLASEFGSGDQKCQVQRINLRAEQRGRHVAAGDAHGQPFRQCGFADARFAQQQRIVLHLFAENLNHGVKLRFPADQRFEFVAGSRLRQVSRIGFERIFLRFAVAVLRGRFRTLLCKGGFLSGNRLGRSGDSRRLKRPLNFADGIEEHRAHGVHRPPERVQHDQRRAAVLIQKLLPDMRDAGEYLFFRVCICNRPQQRALRMRRQSRHAGKAHFSLAAAAQNFFFNLPGCQIAEDAAGQLVTDAAQTAEQVSAAHLFVPHRGRADLRLNQGFHRALGKNIGNIQQLGIPPCPPGRVSRSGDAWPKRGSCCAAFPRKARPSWSAAAEPPAAKARPSSAWPHPAKRSSRFPDDRRFSSRPPN